MNENDKKESLLWIRKAVLEEAHQLAYIKAQAYAEDRLKSLPDVDNVPEWYDGEWYVGLGKIDVQEASRLIGQFECYFIMLEEVQIGTLWIHIEEENSLSLEDFCILPEYQGNGYGTIALDLLEKQYPQNKVWKLGTPYFCRRNRHLYEKVGYNEVGRVSKNTVILYEKHL